MADKVVSLQYPDLNSTTSHPVFYADDNRYSGYRLLYGSFGIRNEDQLYVQSVLLLDQNNQVIHSWGLKNSIIVASTSSMDHVPGYKNPAKRWPHGFKVFSDGSIVMGDDNRGTGLYKLDVCSRLQWSSYSPYSNVVQQGHKDGSIWTIRDDIAVQLDVDSGEVLDEISINELHLANPGIAIFTPRRSLRVSKWYHDPVSMNEVEPLPSSLAESFPQFKSGDLLVGFRSLNLFTVIDPKTRKIKWWRSGISLRQYDLDWEPDGTISVFDNNFRENTNRSDGNFTPRQTPFSRIVKIDPETMAVSVLVAGKHHNFYSSRYGKHQILGNGNVLFSSPEQGRFMEVTPSGEVAFEFINKVDENSVMVVSEARWLPADFFSIDLDNQNCGD